MHIDQLRIRNFRCFEDRSFVLDERFTLLVGKNATGKTALLDATAVTLGAALRSMPEATSRPIRQRDVRRTWNRLGEVGEVNPHYPVRVEAVGSVAGARLDWNCELRTPKSRTTLAGSRVVRDAVNGLLQRSKDERDAVLPCIGYYGTDRLWREPPRAAREGGVNPGRPESRCAGYRDCLSPGSSSQSLIAWAKRMALIEAQRRAAQPDSRLFTLAAVFGAMTKCVEDAMRAGFVFEEDDIQVEFPEKGCVPFRSLSDGQRNMAAIAADIAMRCAQLNPQLERRASRETPGIVLIDEIDLHLHPRWQRSVVGDLIDTFPRIQFVATSHSPFIIQSVSRGGVINLDREDDRPATPDEQSIEDVAEYIMGVEQPQRSRRFREMIEVAEQYYGAIENGAGQDPDAVRDLRERLDRLEEPFADNPAYVAFLRMQRPSSLRD